MTLAIGIDSKTLDLVKFSFDWDLKYLLAKHKSWFCFSKFWLIWSRFNIDVVSTKSSNSSSSSFIASLIWFEFSS